MRLEKRLIVTTAVVVLTACGTLLGGDEDAASTTGDGNDAGVSGDADADAPSVATGDGAFDASPCPSGRGPAMVLVSDPSGGGATFCIDATEVTRADYAAFLAALVPGSAPDPSPCQAKTSYVPTKQTNCESDLALTFPARPVACVDFCDARKFCEWAGKRLCHVAPPVAEIESACGRFGAQNYPWGPDIGDGGCNVADYGAGHAVDVASARRCEGGYTGIFDITGNLSEWEDNCDGTGACNLHGSSFTATDPFFSTCGALTGINFATRNDDLGFRCCADAR